MEKVDVIIPVYRPSKKLFVLLDSLEAQTVPVNQIFLINTEQRYFDILTAGTNFWKKYKNVTVKHISKREFDHGNTRRKGVMLSDTPYFVMMTDDAFPADTHMLARLLAPLWEKKAQMSYARQLPAEDCGVIERFTRSFNYPGQPSLKTKADMDRLGIKTFFASNVCAAYERETYEKLGGFVKRTIFNEDMIYARGLIEQGGCIAYAADACVIHSHNYSGREQLKRNFDLGVSHAEYIEVFSGLKTEGEGIKLVKRTIRHLFAVHKPWLVFRLLWQSGCKYLGFFMGKRYRKLPLRLRRAFSMNREYWK